MTKHNYNTAPHGFYRPASKEAALALLLVLLSSIVSAAEIYFGFYTGSALILCAGFIEASGIAFDAIVGAGIKSSAKAPDLSFNFSSGKHESLALVVKGSLCAGVLIYSIINAFRQFNHPSAASGMLEFIVFLTAVMLIKALVARKLRKTAKETGSNTLLKEAESLKSLSFINILLFSAALLIAYFSYKEISEAANYIDIVSSFLISAGAIAPTVMNLKESLRELLDIAIPEDEQFEIMSIISENINLFCEFKSVNARKSGNKTIIELDIILPDDYSLAQSRAIEKALTEKLRAKFPNSLARVYSYPCQRDCAYSAPFNCPIKSPLDSF